MHYTAVVKKHLLLQDIPFTPSFLRHLNFVHLFALVIDVQFSNKDKNRPIRRYGERNDKEKIPSG